MLLTQYIQQLKTDPAFMANVTAWREVPARSARYAPFPEGVDKRIIEAMAQRGIHSLYTHQEQAVRFSMQGKDIAVVTPTASGKTLCYNLPVLTEILKDPTSRALYLFPTKALSQDQSSELYELIEAMHEEIKCFTYDGDTDAAARMAIRQAGQIVITNPDMLHSGILPHHTKWVKLFENLKYIVIDELHTYRGIFGSNLANVLRRLLRLCEFYGSRPRFICCSATIRNPKELAEILTERSMTLVDDNGAPAGRRNVVFYNPPVVNRQLGIRASSLDTTVTLAEGFLKNDIQTIIFNRSRVQVEVTVRRLKDSIHEEAGNSGRIRGYRGGYLPSERRQIEKQLRAGQISTVVSTNALELGIDIGQLDVCIINGYPGTIASTWQQAGRAGRRGAESLMILVGNSQPIDQYLMAHPDYLMGQSPEQALVNPDNLYVLMDHIKCAAYELPFKEGEGFGRAQSVAEMLEYLCEEKILNYVAGKYYWMAEEFPQAGIHLRTGGEQNFVIVDITNPAHHRVIGEMDRYTVPMLLHRYAIYYHEAQQYQVEKLDFTEKKAYVRAVDVDYYTDADLLISMKVLDETDSRDMGSIRRCQGEVLVSYMTRMFKKMKLDTGENLGWGKVELPETELQTTACWWALPEDLEIKYGREAVQDALVGLCHLLRAIAPLHLMCDRSDIAVTYHVKDTFTDRPTIFIYDCVPGGTGLSDHVYTMEKQLFIEALARLEECPCEHGCPGCVGVSVGKGTKDVLKAILHAICAE